MIRYEKLTRVTRRDVEQINALIRQLSENLTPLERRDIVNVIREEKTAVIVARSENGTVIGIATIFIQELLSGRTAFVEDVVVDEAHRRQGIGEALMEQLHAFAKAAGAKVVKLTSGRHRTAAHALYRKLGYTEKDSTPFQLLLTDENESPR
jgi:ribosomal protein S18 acetylase RimI-like enzyme